MQPALAPKSTNKSAFFLLFHPWTKKKDHRRGEKEDRRKGGGLRFGTACRHTTVRKQTQTALDST
jgi:hypothetical protein